MYYRVILSVEVPDFSSKTTVYALMIGTYFILTMLQSIMQVVEINN
jgi:hypothetical protein